MIYRLTKAQIITLLISVAFLIFVIWKINPFRKKYVVNDAITNQITIDSLQKQITKQQQLIVYVDSCNVLLIAQSDSLKQIIVTKQNEIKLLNKKKKLC